MGRMVAAGWIGRSAVESRLFDVCATNGLVRDTGMHAVRATIRSGLEAGLKEPHRPLSDRPLNGNSFKSERPETAQAPSIKELLSICAADVKMKVVTWLWPDRFAIGKLGIIAGLPDEGKGQILAFLCAAVTKGGEWPMNEGRAPKGKVIVFSDEDDVADTLAPRLEAAGADRCHVEIIKMVREEGRDRLFSLISDLEALRQKIENVSNVKLVVIDPISAYLGGLGKIDSFRTTDVRAVLTPLVTLAAVMKIAIIGVMHFNKKMDVTNALVRISDSLAFGAVARHAYGVIDDSENGRKLFVRAKNNVSARSKDKTLAYRFGAREVGKDEETGETIIAPYIIWEPEYVNVTAMEAMQAAVDNRSPGARDEAKKFLGDMLVKGPVLKTEIEEAAEANSISEKTLRRAKVDLGVIAEKDRSKADGKWYWKLPPSQATQTDPRSAR
jgi:putative DNA primase/helicase